MSKTRCKWFQVTISSLTELFQEIAVITSSH
jgi:hypothetical protein